MRTFPCPCSPSVYSCAIERILFVYRAKAFIDNAIQGGGRVLVHCNGTRFCLCWVLSIGVKRPFNEHGVFIPVQPLMAYKPVVMLQPIHNPLPPPFLTRVSGGISSSPAFVIMFVMQHFQISWEDALHYVQNRRYCISPNSGFITQIKVRHSSQPCPAKRGLSQRFED